MKVKMLSSGQSVYFVDEKDLENIIKKHNPDLKTGNLDIPLLEREVSKMNAVDSANIYLNLNGTLHLDIQQKIPVFRLTNGKKVCYVDEKGQEFNLSKKYSFPCMLVSGKIDKQEYLPIIEWIKAVEKDDFCKKYFIGISKKKNDYYLLTNDGHFKVEIGSLEDRDFKILGFKTFAKKYLAFQDQKKYKKISLKYKNQIITTLR